MTMKNYYFEYIIFISDIFRKTFIVKLNLCLLVSKVLILLIAHKLSNVHNSIVPLIDIDVEKRINFKRKI